LVAVGTLVAGLAIAYAIIVHYFHVSEVPVERHFGAAGADSEPAQIYIELVSIDALNDAMQMRVSLAPSGTLYGERLAPTERSLRLVIIHDKAVEEIKIAANDRVSTATFEVDLNDGSVADYPLDSYRAELRVQLLEEVTPLADGVRPAVVKITVWEGVLGFHLRATEETGSDPGEVRLTLRIRRSGAFALFAFAAYGAMVVLGSCALAIGSVTFVDLRRAGATLIGALAAVAFALPVLRNALPGAPPLGVHADVFVFLWTELAAVASSDEAPERDDQFACQRDDHCLARANTAITGAGAIPQCQRALLLKHQKAPGELDHAAADPGVAGSGKALFASLRTALIRRACQAGVARHCSTVTHWPGEHLMNQHVSRLDTNADDSGQQPNHGVGPGLRLPL
jgi:hypothetical protein